jgi:hypothetical protein
MLNRLKSIFDLRFAGRFFLVLNRDNKLTPTEAPGRNVSNRMLRISTRSIGNLNNNKFGCWVLSNPLAPFNQQVNELIF